jgi:hypothetical protein
MRVKRDPEIKIALRLMTQYKGLAAINEALTAIQKQGGHQVHMVLSIGGQAPRRSGNGSRYHRARHQETRILFPF